MPTETKLHWRVDTAALLREMVEGNPSGGILRQPVNILLGILELVAKRAIELDDPQLNVLMLRMNMYDVPVAEITRAIENQQSRNKE